LSPILTVGESAIAKRALCAIAFMRGFAQCPKGTLRERVSLAAPDDSAGAVRHRLLSSSVAQTLRVPSPGGSALSAGLTAVGAWTIAPEGTEKSAIALGGALPIAKRALCAIAIISGPSSSLSLRPLLSSTVSLNFFGRRKTFPSGA